jgi:glutathione S-transferase
MMRPLAPDEVSMPDSPPLVLHMFPSPHFNEKARWARDWKGLAHTRIAYLPGPHAPQMQRLSGRQQVPA